LNEFSKELSGELSDEFSSELSGELCGPASLTSRRVSTERFIDSQFSLGMTEPGG